MCVMISCLIFFASCCAAEPPLPACNAAGCPLYHQGMLSHIVFIMLGCLIFSILARLLDLPYLMSGCLLSPKTCCAICSCFQDATLFDLIRLMLRCCATLATSYCWVIFFSDLCFLVIWSCLHDVKRLSLLSFLIFSASCYVLALPCLIWGLVFKMLCCLIFSTSCYALSPASLPHVAWCSLYIRSSLFGHLILPSWC